MRGSRLAFEAGTLEDSEAEYKVTYKNLLVRQNDEDKLNWISEDGLVRYECVKYSDLTQDYISNLNPTIVYFNDCSNSELAYMYDKYNNGVSAEYVKENYSVDSSSFNINSGVAEELFDRIKSDSVIVMFSDNLRKLGDNGLNNLQLLYLMTNIMYPNVVDVLGLSDYFDSGKSMGDLLDSVYGITKGTMETLPTYGIDNATLKAGGFVGDIDFRIVLHTNDKIKTPAISKIYIEYE